MRKALSPQACLLILGLAPGQIQIMMAQWVIFYSSFSSVNFSFSALVASHPLTMMSSPNMSMLMLKTAHINPFEVFEAAISWSNDADVTINKENKECLNLIHLILKAFNECGDLHIVDHLSTASANALYETKT
jgi:hypothetical protein